VVLIMSAQTKVERGQARLPDLRGFL